MITREDGWQGVVTREDGAHLEQRLLRDLVTRDDALDAHRAPQPLREREVQHRLAVARAHLVSARLGVRDRVRVRVRVRVRARARVRVRVRVRRTLTLT